MKKIIITTILITIIASSAYANKKAVTGLTDSTGTEYSNSNPIPVSVNNNVIERYNVSTPYNGAISSAATWTAVNITDADVFIVEVRDFPGEGRIAFDDATTNYQTLSGLLGGETVYPTEVNVSTVNFYSNSATGNYQFSVIPR